MASAYGGVSMRLSRMSGFVCLVSLACAAGVIAQDAEDTEGLRHRVDQLEAVVGQLEERLSNIEYPAQPLSISVSCGSGQTVGEALAQHHDWLGPLYIAVSGMCEESVTILRDDVSIWSGTGGSGDGLQLPQDSPNFVVSVNAGQRIRLRDLTIRGGRGVVASNGSSVSGANLTIQGSGVNVHGGAFGSFFDCTLADSQFGASANDGGVLHLQECTIKGNVHGVVAAIGGSVLLVDPTITQNSWAGVTAGSGEILIHGGTIENNPNTGVEAYHHASVFLSGTRVANNGNYGVAADKNSFVDVALSTVENNFPGGIVASTGAMVVISSTIRGNRDGGVFLQGTARAVLEGEVHINNNGGWGISCEGPPVIAPIQLEFLTTNVDLSGNAAGPTNCPVN